MSIENYPLADHHSFKDYGTLHFLGDESRTDTPYMGFELEVDRDDETDITDMIKWIENHMPKQYFYFEEERCCEHGWENISQPCSLSYYLSMRDRFKELFEYLIKNGMRSHDAKDCGFHIHLDRSFFGNREDSSIAKLLYIFEKFRPELLVFSRRTMEKANKWARSRKDEFKQQPWLSESIKHPYSSHYTAVNLTHTNTIEIRLWRGTLNLETFMATLKFTARLAVLCREVRAVDLAEMSFEDLLGDDTEILSYWKRAKKKKDLTQMKFNDLLKHIDEISVNELMDNLNKMDRDYLWDNIDKISSDDLREKLLEKMFAYFSQKMSSSLNLTKENSL